MKRDRHFYFMVVNGNILKQGYSKNVDRRLKELKRTYKTNDVVIVWTSDIPMTEQTAMNNEKRIRKQIAQKYHLRHIPHDRYQLVEDITLVLSIRSTCRIDISLSF